MTSKLLLLLSFVIMAGCATRDEPARILPQDSVLLTPATLDTHSHVMALKNGLVIDSSRLLPADREKALARFTPRQMLAIYQAYQPLRRTAITQAQLDSFLQEQHITTTELRAVLEQGDRLGWNTGHTSAK